MGRTRMDGFRKDAVRIAALMHFATAAVRAMCSESPKEPRLPLFCSVANVGFG